MRACIPLLVVSLALSLIAPAADAQSQDAEALRRELEQLRRRMEQTQRQYQQSIDALSERLRRLESAPPPVAAPPAAPTTAAPAPAAPAPAPPTARGPAPQGPGVQPPVTDLLRPRQPFGLYGQRGTGQLLFDMGITGDFIASFTGHRAEKAGAATFGSRANRFFPREIELNLFGQVDPYAYAEVRIESGEEEPGAEMSVRLAEASLTLLTLPYGFQAKMGRLRNRFGLTNVIHEHDLPFIDRPNVLRNFFGEDGLVEKGAEVTWVPALPFYLELLGGVFNGDNETAFGRGRLTEPLVTGRVRSFVEITDTSAVQFGVSGAHGQTAERLDSTVVGYDVKYKYRPESWLHPLLTLSSEGLYSIRRVEDSGERGAFGWYLHGELQPFRRWALGARYDASQFADRAGFEWAIGPYVALYPSDFLRFRLGYKHTERDRASLFAANDTTARIVNEVLWQATFILGAHPAHPF